MEGVKKTQNSKQEKKVDLESKEKFMLKIEVSLLSYEEELKRMIHFSRSMGDNLFFQKRLWKNFPGLWDEIKDSKDLDSQIPFFEKYLKEKRETNEKRNNQIKIFLEEIFKEKGSIFIEKLLKIIDGKFLQDKNINIGINNVMSGGQYNPHNQAVSVSSREDNKSALHTSMHEIIHLPIFYKLQNLFKEEGSSFNFMTKNSLQWKLSEIIVKIILDEDKEIKEIFNLEEKYTSNSHEFLNNKIGNISALEYFTKIYLDSRNANESFDVTMKKIYEEAKLHEKELEFYYG